MKQTVIKRFYFNTIKKQQPWVLPGGLTYDHSGFDGVHHLLQGLYVSVIVSELQLLVVEIASSLNE